MVLVRHGETDWSRSGRHTGRTDVPLCAEGLAEAAALKGHLDGWSFVQVLSSPSSRAVETCTLAGFAGRAELTDDLLEWDYGAAEGRTTDEIRRTVPGWTLWTDGVAGGETAAEVGLRADRVIERALGAAGDTLCFAHGHVLRVLAARWVGLPSSCGRVLLLGPGSSSVLGWERETPAIERWNERVAGRR
jgi:probable phosphoglycerate mutase